MGQPPDPDRGPALEGGAGSGQHRRRAGSSQEDKASHALRIPPWLRDLGHRKTRTVLTVLGIGVGVSALVAFNGISPSMIDQLNNIAGGNSIGDLTLMQRDLPDLSLSTIDETTGRAIQGMPQVKSVSGMVMGFASAPGLPFFFVSGLEPDEPPCATT